MKPFEIFKTGTHTSAEGRTLTFGESELASMARSYDPQIHHAPIVVGHPKTDAPAYGWVNGLSVTDGRLVAEPGDVDPAFADLVKKRRFGKVSASFYTPDAPANPAPGSWYLRHVGFLGAQPPAVKGLKPVEFGDAEQGVEVVEFADWEVSQTASTTARLFRSIRDWIIAQVGVEKADQVVPDWQIEQLNQTAVDAASDDVRPLGYADQETTVTDKDASALADDIEARIGAIEAREKELQARELEFAESRRKARAAEDAKTVEAIVEAGRLPAGLQDTAIALFAELGDDVASFGEGDGKVTARAAFRSLLEGLPIPVETRELAKGKAGDAVDFSDPLAIAGVIAAEVERARTAGETISPAEALGRINQAK